MFNREDRTIPSLFNREDRTIPSLFNREDRTIPSLLDRESWKFGTTILCPFWLYYTNLYPANSLIVDEYNPIQMDQGQNFKFTDDGPSDWGKVTAIKELTDIKRHNMEFEKYNDDDDDNLFDYLIDDICRNSW